ncbi:Membrane-bound lytic murein transglycosylase D [Thalassocella blandensis]|nr:Membrane-bound lytic murein transglycosylase D [Thalassocella blandensis]
MPTGIQSIRLYMIFKAFTDTRTFQLPRSATLILTLLPVLHLAGCGLQNLKLGADNPPEPAVISQGEFEIFDENCSVSDEEFEQISDIAALDLWDRIRAGYQLPQTDHARILQEISWYSRHPNYMSRVTERGQRYLYYVVEELEKRNMPMELALLPIVESAFDPFAYSHGRASGMWQIIPGTGKMLGLKQNWWYDGRRDIVASTGAALDYLEQLHKRFDGDWLQAIAAYNSGGGNVSRAIKKNKRKGKPTDFFSLDLPRETKAYVPRLIALAILVQYPEDYGLSLFSIPNDPYFETVEINSQIDLAQAADMAEIDMDELYHLNPGFNRWATDPKGPHRLLVPLGQGPLMSEKLAAIAPEDRVTWDRYTIKNGDTLSSIAAKYNVSVASLKSINDLRGSNIRAGKKLMVPIATKDDSHYSFSSSQRLAKKQAAYDKKENGQAIDYVVQSGDSFWSISRKYDVSVRKLAKWNNLAPRDPIKPGQTLKIWTDLPTIKNFSAGSVVRKVSYRVRSGDSLSRIASKFSLNVNDIVKWNQLQNSKYLQPGQSLTLFVDVTKTGS